MQNIPKDIIIRATEGDIEAFEEIYNLSSSYVYTLAYRVTQNAEDAQEVTQDVFVSVYRNLDRFQFRSSFKTWIYRIATNMAINMYRKRSKERGRKVVFDETIGTDHPAGKTEVFDKEDNEARVNNMLKDLPPEQRACLVLKSIEGLKYHEIAKVLNININTVRSRLKRAREKLIAQYRKRGQS